MLRYGIVLLICIEGNYKYSLRKSQKGNVVRCL